MSLKSDKESYGSYSDSDVNESIIEQVQSKDAPDVKRIVTCLSDACNGLNEFFDRCRKNYNVVKCKWEGQSDDQRKHDTDGVTAYPWDGASDAKVPLVDDANRLIKKTFKTALKRMRVQAIPINATKEDVANSHYASYFLKYLKQNIPNFDGIADYAATQLLDIAGVAAAKVEYARERRTVKKEYKLAQLPEEIQQAILSAVEDDKLVEFFAPKLPKMSEKKLREAIVSLRETGKAKVTEEIAVREGVRVHPMSLCENLILPAGCADVQDASFVFEVREFTPEQLLQEAKDKGWDEDWAHEVIEKQVGIDSISSFILGKNDRNSDVITTSNDRMTGLIQIVYAWEKRIDAEDGSIGVYYTVMHPEYTEGYGIFELADCEDGLYPFIVKKRENFSASLYDTRALTEVLEGYQFSYKECLDNAANREAISTCPPFEVRATGGLDSADAQDIGPGTPMVSHIGNSFEWKNPIQGGGENINIEMRRELRNLVDQYVGRPSAEVAPSEAAVKVQDEVDIIAQFITDVLKMAERKFRQYAPDEFAFKIVGMADMFVWKNNQMPEFDYIITLDAASIEDLEKKVAMFSQLMMADRTGKIDNSKYVEAVAPMIDPVLADYTITGDETAYNKSLEQERGAINTITSGQDVDIPPEEPFNQVKAQYYMQYLQSPAGQSGLQNPIVAPLLQKRAEQWQFKMEQQNNAQVGRLGTNPGNAGQM